MRVLMTTSTLPRRSGDAVPSFVLDLAVALRKLGTDVHLLAPSDAEGAEDELGGVPVHRYRYAWPRSAEVLFHRGGIGPTLSSKPWLAPLTTTAIGSQAAAVRRLVRAAPFDLVHAHWLVPQGLAAVWAGVGVPVLVSVHGGDVFSFSGRQSSRLKAWVAKRASAVTVNGAVARQAVLELTGGAVVPEIIPTGAVIPDPRPAAVAGWRDRFGDRLTLAFAGRLVEEKGVLDAVAATALLNGQGLDLQLVVGGAGPLESEVDRRAAELGIPDRVLRVGWVPDVSAFFAAADVVVLPSKRSPTGWREAQGLTMIEAMASGTPLVSTSSGGIPDVVEDGVSGLLVPEGAPAAIAEAITHLLSDPDLSAGLARAGRLRSTAFEVGRSASSIRDAYERMLS